MSDNKRSGRGFSGKGYYIALILCAAAIGITGYVFYSSDSEPVQTALQETQTDRVLLDVTDAGEVPVLATQPQATQPSTVQTEPPATVKQPMKTVAPVSGDPVFGYAMEALSYNQTTRDWRVHNGIDLAAQAGTPVCAAADGEVTGVFEDDAYGYTVEIRHADGYTTRYASLAEDCPVRVGDTVTAGQTVGCVSDSAIVEQTMGDHVHFSVTRHGESMDPMEFLLIGQ